MDSMDCALRNGGNRYGRSRRSPARVMLKMLCYNVGYIDKAAIE